MDVPRLTRDQGFLQLPGEGGLSVADMQDLLHVIGRSYAVAWHVDVVTRGYAASLIRSERWLRRWGPEPWIGRLDPAALNLASSNRLSTDRPLVVSKVVLRSPGFWEFMGTLNPLEVLRNYLTDRHERKKDNDYRSRAEEEALTLDNTVRRLEIWEQVRRIEREYGPPSDVLAPLDAALREQITAALRPELQALGELADRGIIEGSGARTSREPPRELERGDDA